MATVDLTAGQVMNGAAALLNDSARVIYNYTAQLPYLNMALQELQEEFERHSVATTQKTSAVIQMNAGQTEIVFNGVGVPSLPSDLIEPAELWERPRGIDPWIPMTKKEYLPHDLAGTPISSFIYYVWQENKIIVMPATADNDIKMDYVRDLFTVADSDATIINVINGKTFLQYRTAGLIAELIQRDTTAADALNANAALAANRSLGITVKGKQNIATRRRAFRSGYKRRTILT